MPGFLLESESAERLARLLIAFENGKFAPGHDANDPSRAPSAPIVQIVRVTSTTPTGDGTYPGQLQFHDASTNAWSNLEEVRVREVNGNALALAKYVGRYAGENSGNYAVYQTVATGGAVLSLDFVTAISCVGGVITPVYSTVCIPGAYLCTTTTTTAAPTTTTTTAGP